MIDWTKPIETDEATPRPLEIARHNPADNLRYGVVWSYEPRTIVWFDGDGMPEPAFTGCRIRNVIAKFPPELSDRMVALVRKVATSNLDGTLHEAQEIAKLLPEPPVDPDLIEARKIAHSTHAHVTDDRSFLDGTYDDGDFVQSTLAAIKRGRELEREAIGAP
jgi:hypothetical protein